MKAINGALLSMGLVGTVLYIGLILGLLSMTVYGIYLAFSASIILGVISLFVEPSQFIFGIVMFCFHKNLPQMLIDWLSK